MSVWTYVTGVVEVSPMGRTQAEMTYTLETALAHLPKVTGEEGDMKYKIFKNFGYNTSRSHNEFDEYSRDWIKEQGRYLILVNGDLRDRLFSETFKELNNWLNRLAKRVMVEDVLIKLNGTEGWGIQKEYIFLENNNVYNNMFEYPSWSSPNESNWCEYLMWDADTIGGSSYPDKLLKKRKKDFYERLSTKNKVYYKEDNPGVFDDF